MGEREESVGLTTCIRPHCLPGPGHFWASEPQSTRTVPLGAPWIDLGWGCTGAALGWQRLSPFALAWPGGKAETLMGLLGVDSDSPADPTHEHGRGSRTS